MARQPDNTRADLAHRDVEHLMQLPQFHRFLFTALERSGMWASAYGSEERHLLALEGRRSLGFDMLKDAERVRPDALLAILQAELHASKGLVDDDPIRHDEQLRPDDGNDGQRPRASFAGYDVIDYGTAGKAD